MAGINNGANDENELLVMFGGNENGGGACGENSNGREGGGNVEEVALKKGPWTAAEDAILTDYVTKHGEGNWNSVQRNTGLNRCGKSCRLRWANHLRPNLKKGAFSPEEEKLIIDLHSQFGNKWARMAALLPGRTDNEIKNYWNTRIKRRQRQGLPLYSDDNNHHQRLTPPTIPTASNPNNTLTNFDIFNQNQHQQHQNQNQYQQQQHPLSPTTIHHSPLQHRPFTSSSSSHIFLDPSPLPLSSPSPSFTFQRPAPMLCNPLRFKRHRSSPTFNNLPDSSLTTTQFPHLDGFRFPSVQGFSQFFQPSLLDHTDCGVSTSSSIFQPKLELPSSNQFYKPPHEQELKLDIDFNDPSFHSSSGLLGDLLFEAQTLALGQNSKKRSYSSLNEGNDVFDGCQGFEDLSPTSLCWPSSSAPKPKEDAHDFSKFMNEDISSLLTVVPSSNMQTHEWHNINNSAAAEMSNVQSSGSGTTDDNFGLDIKPIASLFPLTNTTNHNENEGCYSWENFHSLC